MYGQFCSLSSLPCHSVSDWQSATQKFCWIFMKINTKSLLLKIFEEFVFRKKKIGTRKATFHCLNIFIYLFSTYVYAIMDKPFGDGFFFLILAHSVFKMWVIQKPNKAALWNKRHFEEKKWRLYSMFKIFGTDICWINIKWGI